MKNEIKERRIIKQYEEYYTHYNKLVRPMEEKTPVRETEGVVSWVEGKDVHTTKLSVVGGDE